jgi:hypothetical protein
MVVVAQVIRTLTARAFRLSIAGAGRALPRSLRFHYARIASQVLGPIITYRLRPMAHLGPLNSDFELSLGYVIRAMTEHGCEFDVPVRVHGEEAIPGDGALFVSGHLYLAIACVRFLCDRGVPMSLVRQTPEEHHLIGTRKPLPIIISDKFVFVRIRNALRAGRSVAVLLDHATTGGLTIHQQAIGVAILSRVPIVFFGANAGEDGVIEVFFERPRGSDVGEISRELLAFIKRLAPG